MNTFWKSTIIGAIAVVGIVFMIKFMPLYATFVAVGSFAFGCFAGYIIKKEEIVRIYTPTLSTGYSNTSITCDNNTSCKEDISCKNTEASSIEKISVKTVKTKKKKQ